MFEGERLRILSVECVSGSHNLTLLSSVEQTLTESSPNDLNAKQRPRALVKKKKTIIGKIKWEEEERSLQEMHKCKKKLSQIQAFCFHSEVTIC